VPGSRHNVDSRSHDPHQTIGSSRNASIQLEGRGAGHRPGGGQAPGESATAGLNQRALLNFNSCPKPVYPAEALARKARGTVDLAFLVGVDGKAVEKWESVKYVWDPS
jgi:outer membrane biosynthesis protein TonB